MNAIKRKLAALLMAAVAVCLLLAGCIKPGREPDPVPEKPPVASSADTEGDNDVHEKKRETYYLAAGEKPRVGDTVFFGSYEQDNEKDNGAEQIEWTVLETDGGEALLISKYCLDRIAFHRDQGSIRWEDCHLRGWLNGEFYSAAFSKEEKERIALSTVKAENNEVYSVDGGSDTKDRVYILSIKEAESYFPEQADRIALATPYAASKNRHIAERPDGCWWWLRTPGYRGKFAGNVRYDGLVGNIGQQPDAPDHCVRPVIRVEC